ncbi:MAG TPA: ABC transporter ATP-binding protein [Candidatus Merdenecus merdavium]|nr:ABC transporter ATP-binding protein [Candidatus Merdenecus merdavium]
MIKQLSRCIKEYKKESLLAPLFMSVEVVLEISIPYFMSKIIDHGLNKGNQGYVARTGTLLVFAALLSLIFGALSGKFSAKASTGFAKNLRKEMYHNIQNFSFSNIDKFSTSSLVTRMTTDVTNVQNAYQMIIRVMVRSVLMQVFCIVMVLRINADLALIFALAIPILGVGLFIIITKAHPIFEKVFRTYDKLNRVVQENVRGIRVVKSYVREDREIEKFETVSNEIYRNFTRAEKILAFNSPMMQIVMYACLISIFWAGGHKIVAGSLTTGQLMSLITYVTQSLFSLMMLSMVFVMIIISKASIQRIGEVLVEESDLHSPKDPIMEVKDGSIEFNHVSFSYTGDENKECLKDIHFSLASGETLGIIGETGSAKSSLVQLIPRLYDITEGSLKVGGVETKDYDLEVLREHVAMVLQKNVLFSGTIKENLRWGNPNATDEELIHVCKLAQAHEFIMEFKEGYDTFIEQGGSNVSGGQRQRLCIARALLKKPKILILDDSTSAVDTKTDAKLQAAFLQEIPDTTKITIAQRISSVENADKILILNEGRVHAIGSHEELLKTNTIYQELYYTQKKGGDEHGTEQ